MKLLFLDFISHLAYRLNNHNEISTIDTSAEEHRNLPIDFDEEFQRVFHLLCNGKLANSLCFGQDPTISRRDTGFLRFGRKR